MVDKIKQELNEITLIKDSHQYDKALERLQKIEEDVRQDPLLHRRFLHLKAQAIYQNREHSSRTRFDNALSVLDELPENYETKRLKGAIYKRKYQSTKSLDDLYKAIHHYESASKNQDKDLGYGVVNAIFLYYTLMNHLRLSWSEKEQKICQRKINRLATKTLNYILEKYPDVVSRRKHSEWLEPILAELYLDLYQFDDCKKALQHSFENDSGTSISRKEYTTTEQLVKLYDLLPDESSKEQMPLANLFDGAFYAKKSFHVSVIAKSVRIGKVGLALSGGGFRASIFHIGMLHRLAELDILRHVEVISSVSGGSIVAMHYYLKLKRLLEKNDNYSLDKTDYIELVNALEEEFTVGVQTNIRMQAFAGLSYDITNSLGELYQKQLFNRTGQCTPTFMDQLKIYPNVGGHLRKEFHPHHHNFELKNKVPILIINATNFNNGHNWRFTATGMGESPEMYDTTVDKNSVMLYSTYGKFQEEHRKVTIGMAVAASSAVPVLFDPIDIGDPFNQKDTIQLVDGGIYDNQGLASVIDEECDIIITSDASKHLEEQSAPSTFRLNVNSRLTDVLMNKTRDSEFKIAKELKRSKKIKGLSIIHLKQCFDAKIVTPLPQKPPSKLETSFCKETTLYPPLDKEIQEALAVIRTDLDAFHDVEAKALIKSGYEVTSHWFQTYGVKQVAWKEFDIGASKTLKFKKLDQKISNSKERQYVLKLLKVSSKQLSKLLELSKVCGLILILLFGGLIEHIIFNYSDYDFLIQQGLVWIGFGSILIGGSLFFSLGKRLLKIVSNFILYTALKIVARGYLKVCNPIYLKKGKL